MGIEYIDTVPACPICGKRFFLAYDGFEYKAGCSGYIPGDGIHYRTLLKHHLKSRDACIAWWMGVTA